MYTQNSCCHSWTGRPGRSEDGILWTCRGPRRSPRGPISAASSRVYHYMNYYYYVIYIYVIICITIYIYVLLYMWYIYIYMYYSHYVCIYIYTIHSIHNIRCWISGLHCPYEATSFMGARPGWCFKMGRGLRGPGGFQGDPLDVFWIWIKHTYA